MAIREALITIDLIDIPDEARGKVESGEMSVAQALAVFGIKPADNSDFLSLGRSVAERINRLVMDEVFGEK